MLTRDHRTTGRFVVPLRNSGSRIIGRAWYCMRDLIYLREWSYGLHVKQGEFSSQPCILQSLPLLVYCQLLRWQSLHHCSNVALIRRHWPRNILATTLPGTRIAYHTLNAPIPTYRMSTTTGGRSSELTNETWESVATFPQVCLTISQGTATWTNLLSRVFGRRQLATGALGIPERCHRIPHRRRTMAA